MSVMLNASMSIASEPSERAKRTAPGVVRLSGRVVRGASFEGRLWDELKLRLNSIGDGWVISVATAATSETDCVWVVTPPYRSDNPRFIGPGHGRSAEEAAAWTPRVFRFVENATDYHKAEGIVRGLLWSPSDPVSASSGADGLSAVPRASALLSITSATVVRGGSGVGALAYMAFEIEVRRSVDLQEALRDKFLRERSEYESLSEACPGADPITVGLAAYHDLDGDGFDEVIVSAHSCLAGTGGSDLIGVFARDAEGKVRELRIDDLGASMPGARQGLRGKAVPKVLSGRLVMEYPVYRSGDANCCPSGGIRRFWYSQKGKAFLPERYEDIPADTSP